MSSDLNSGEVLSAARVSRLAFFMSIARLYATRSTCLRAHVGAIAVVDNNIVASGYVGSPKGEAHCTEIGCQFVEGHCVRTIHAEANVIARAARSGIRLEGAQLFTTHSPCPYCAKLIVNAGFSEVIYGEFYHDGKEGLELLRRRDIAVRVCR